MEAVFPFDLCFSLRERAAMSHCSGVIAGLWRRRPDSSSVIATSL